MKIFDIFHVFLLESVSNQLRKNSDVHSSEADRQSEYSDEEISYDVERILDFRKENGQLQYKIK